MPPREPIQGLWRSFKIWRSQERRDGAGRPRRFPAPWRVIEHSESFVVEDANGRPLAYVYFEDEPVRHGLMNRLTSNEARRVVSNIAKLPDLLKKLASRVTAWGT